MHLGQLMLNSTQLQKQLIEGVTRNLVESLPKRWYYIRMVCRMISFDMDGMYRSDDIPVFRPSDTVTMLQYNTVVVLQYYNAIL